MKNLADSIVAVKFIVHLHHTKVLKFSSLLKEMSVCKKYLTMKQIYNLLAYMYLFCFSRYHRCQFELPLNFSGHLDHQLTTGSLTPVNITSFSRWDQISEKLKPSDKPVVLNRASSTNTTNPFGSTFCYGYEDIIFEVMPNFHIASVTLYCQNAGRLNLNQMSHFNSQRFQINEEELLDDRLSSV